MSGPLIPYSKIPTIPLPFPDPFDSIKPFGILVATGVYIGAHVAVTHARRRGLDVNKMNSFILWVVGLGFVGAHVFDAVFYTPERLAENPMYIFKLYAGISSYGGFFGAMFGALAFKFVKGEKVMPLVDTVCSAFPLAWVFGRAGCASVHDHPGRITDSWLGVQYFHPDVGNPDKMWFLFDAAQTKGRFDLGFIEMALTIPLAVAFAVLWAKRPRGYGFYAGWQCIYYAPLRFFLDFIREDAKGVGVHEIDPRTFGLTPAQFACFGLLAIGTLMVHFSKIEPAPASWADVKPWSEEDDTKNKKVDDEDDDEDAPVRPKAKRSSKNKPAAKAAASAAKPKPKAKTPAKKPVDDEEEASTEAEKKPSPEATSSSKESDEDDEDGKDSGKDAS